MKYTYLLLFFMGWSASAQQLLNGQIKIEESGIEMPIDGVNLIWLDTTVGAITNEQGEFEIPMNSNSNQLIISYIGFKTDTLKISTAKKLIHTLLPNTEDVLDEVTITQRRKAIQKSYLEAQNVILVSSEELLKAACCNLSESFETNPSVDVNFADA